VAGAGGAASAKASASLAEARHAEGGERRPGAPAQTKKWNNDEWDVALPDGVYRIYRNRDSNQWFLEAILD
jgi:hypothetical protein